MQISKRSMGQFHNGSNIALRLAALLFVLVCISVWMMDGLFAKYRTSSSGGDNARVMSFGQLTITEEGDFENDHTAILIPGVDLKKKVTVNFTGSESSAYVFVEAGLSSHWSTTDRKNFSAYDNRLNWAVENEWTFLKTEGTGTYIYYQELKPNEVLTAANFIANDGRISVDDKITKSEIVGMTGIQINLRSIVVQANGFKDATAAWASISAQ